MEKREVDSLKNVSNYNSIDLFKFICSIFVVMIHIAPFGNSENSIVVSEVNFFVQNYLARVAVPFFFVGAGFFLYKKISLENFDMGVIKKYVLRLFRLYVIWTIIYFPYILYGFFTNKNGIRYAFLEWVKSFFLTGSYLHLWYINALIVAVLIVSYLLHKKVSPVKMLLISFVFYFVGLFAQSWFGFVAPLRESVPTLWNGMKGVQKIISTTRNGLFEGFLFVTIGMCIAIFDIRLEKRKALWGVCISMVLLLLEVYTLEDFGFIREYDMFLFLIPATFFAFSLIKEIKLADRRIYRDLRILSSLIFYLHLWVGNIVGKFLSIISVPLADSCLKFVISLLVTISGAYVIMKLSNVSKLKWLKKLYG